jgi:hypothetical protein
MPAVFVVVDFCEALGGWQKMEEGKVCGNWGGWKGGRRRGF